MRFLKLASVCLLLSISLASCKPEQAAQAEPPGCETIENSFKLGFGSKWEKVQKLPASGKFVTESHYVNKAEFSAWPKNGADGIDKHLIESCFLYAKYVPTVECSKLYSVKEPWTRVWTPSEGGGHIGGGAVATLPTPEQEMWQGNMMFKGSLPAMGTKFLMKANGRAVVVSFGYEIGPGAEKFLGGVTREVHYYLGSDNDSDVWIGQLKDQSLPYGPITCK